METCLSLDLSPRYRCLLQAADARVRNGTLIQDAHLLPAKRMELTDSRKEDIIQNKSASSRPIGISIIALLLFMQAIFELVVGTFTFIGTTLSPVAKLTAGWLPLVVVILLLILAWALWTLKPWAYWATLTLEIVNIVLHFFGYVQTHTIFAIMSGGIISIIVVIYLLVDRNVRRAFRTGS